MKIIVRNANNDLEAFQTAQAMENAGASVFSIAHDGMHKPEGAMIASSRFVVFAKYDDPVTPDQIDAAISKELYGEEDEE